MACAQRHKKQINSKQVLPIKHIGIQRKNIHPIETTQIHTVMTGLPHRLMESVDTTVFTEEVPSSFITELIQAQRTLLRLDIQRFGGDDFAAHHGALARADGAVAAQAFGYLLAGIGELYRAAVTAALVVLGHNSISPMNTA
jgi:hypothetical protein